MLEKYLPNVYGWLVWGGGMSLIVLGLSILTVLAMLFSIFMLGRLSAWML